MDREVGDVNVPIEILYLIESEPPRVVDLARVLHTDGEFLRNCVVEVLGVVAVLVPRELGRCVVDAGVHSDAALLKQLSGGAL